MKKRTLSKNQSAGVASTTQAENGKRGPRVSSPIVTGRGQCFNADPMAALGEIYRYILGPDWGSKREGELWTDLAEIEAAEAGYKP